MVLGVVYCAIFITKRKGWVLIDTNKSGLVGVELLVIYKGLGFILSEITDVVSKNMKESELDCIR